MMNEILELLDKRKGTLQCFVNNPELKDKYEKEKSGLLMLKYRKQGHRSLRSQIIKIGSYFSVIYILSYLILFFDDILCKKKLFKMFYIKDKILIFLMSAFKIF